MSRSLVIASTYALLALVAGCAAEKPDSLKSLAQAIGRALKANGPTLIEMTPRMLNG